MTDRTDPSQAEVVREFLHAPRNRTNFDPFFALCYRLTLATIRYLRARGFALPIDDRSDSDPFRDLAYDILGRFLASRRDNGEYAPFFVIFDYFYRHNLLPPDSVPDEEIIARLIGLVRTFTRQEIWRLSGEKDPQLANLKRRFNDILICRRFVISESESETAYVSLAGTPVDADLPAVDLTELDRIVREAFRKSKTRTEWCRIVFELLAARPELRQQIRKSDFMAALIAANVEAVELDQKIGFHFDSPSEILLQGQIRNEVSLVLTNCTAHCLDGYVSKGKLKPSETRPVLKAVAELLTEFTETGQMGKIPEYFKCHMPAEAVNRYLKDYKNIMDTTVAKSLTDLRQKLQNNPIVRAFGYYLPDDE